MIVRWLAAFRSARDGRVAAAQAELAGIGREVAAEPLWRGKTLLGGVGLVVDPADFVRGHGRDCWSEPQDDGSLRHTTGRKEGQWISDHHRFMAAWSAERPRHHGEVFCAASPRYEAVAWTPGNRAKAVEVGLATGLPVMDRPIHRMRRD